MVADIRAHMGAIIKASFAKEKVPLADVACIEAGEYITKKDEETGEYPVYGGGGASYYINRFNREATCVINKDGMSAQCVQMVTGRFFLNHHGWTLACTGKALVEKYLHYQLYFRAAELYALATGSCQKGLSQKEFMKVMVYTPPLDVQEATLTRLQALQVQLDGLETLQRQTEDNGRIILESYLGADTGIEHVD
jgi:type I restriction enzyme S subunit